MTKGLAARSWAGLAIRRAAADRWLVAVSALVVVVAATVMVATAVHPAAAASRSAVRALEAADPSTASVIVATDVAPAAAASVDAKVRGILAGALGPIAGTVVASGRSESYRLAGASADGPLTAFAFADGLPGRTRIVEGSWPASGADGTGALEVVLTKPAADRLGLAAGDRATAVSQLEPSREIPIVVAGVIAIDDRADPAWAADPLTLDGSVTAGPFTTAGPLFVDRATLLQRVVVSRASLTWVAIPTFSGLPAAALPSLAASTAAIPDRLAAEVGRAPAVEVTTGLPGLLDGAAAALERAGSGSTAVAGPLVAIALYALVLVAALLVDRRRSSSTLLRARGAGGTELLRLAVVEAVLLAVAGAAAGVPLGIVVVLLVGGTEGWGSGPLPPTVTAWGVALVAATTAAAAAVALLLPTFGSTGPLARLRRLTRRRPGGMAATRSGLDLALLAIAALLLWQLRSGSAASAASGRGLGPLDVAAPAVALLAGAVISLRVTGLAARGAGWLGRRAQAAAPAVAGWSIARRSNSHARLALLVVAATATALFCASIGRSWTTAQRDQAAHATAADVSGAAHSVVGADRVGERAAYLAVPGVTGASRVVGAAFDAGPALRSGHLLAVPANPALAPAALRPDLASRPVPDLLAGLAARRPALPLLPLPSTADHVRVTVAADLRATNGAASPASPAPASPAPVAAARVGVGLVVMAADGSLLQTSPQALAADGSADIALPGPQQAIVAVEVAVTPTTGAGVTGTVHVASVAAGVASGADETAVDLGAVASGWSFTRTSFGIAAQPVDSAPGAPSTATFTSGSPVLGPGATIVAYRPTALAALPETPMAALVDPAMLAGAPTDTSGALAVRFNLADTRRFSVAGTIGSFPGVDGPGLAVVDLGTWQLAAYGATGVVPSPTAWWLATDGRDDAAVVRAVQTGAYPLQDVRSLAAETAARLDNPIAAAVLGSLGAVAAGALLIALLGVLAASAQGGRERRGEVAVVRAQGLPARGLTGWLAAEEVFPLWVGSGAGIALGLLVDALAVPALVRALDGAPAVPPVTVVQPLDLAGAIAVAATVLAAVLTAVRLRATVRVRLAATLRSDAPGVAE